MLAPCRFSVKPTIHRPLLGISPVRIQSWPRVSAMQVPSPRREQKGEGWHSRSGGRIGQDCDSLLNSGVFH